MWLGPSLDLSSPGMSLVMWQTFLEENQEAEEWPHETPMWALIRPLPEALIHRDNI